LKPVNAWKPHVDASLVQHNSFFYVTERERLQIEKSDQIGLENLILGCNLIE